MPRYTGCVSDTTAEIERRQATIHRRMSRAERLSAAVEASLLARGLLLARLRARHPDWSEQDFRRELLRLSLLPDRLPPRVP